MYISLHTSNQLINYKLFPHSMPWAIKCTHSTVSPIESIHSTAEPLNVYIQQFAHWIYTFNGLTRWMYTFNSYLHSIQHIYGRQAVVERQERFDQYILLPGFLPVMWKGYYPFDVRRLIASTQFLFKHCHFVFRHWTILQCLVDDYIGLISGNFPSLTWHEKAYIPVPACLSVQWPGCSAFWSFWAGPVWTPQTGHFRIPAASSPRPQWCSDWHQVASGLTLLMPVNTGNRINNCRFIFDYWSSGTSPTR